MFRNSEFLRVFRRWFRANRKAAAETVVDGWLALTRLPHGLTALARILKEWFHEALLSVGDGWQAVKRFPAGLVKLGAVLKSWSRSLLFNLADAWRALKRLPQAPGEFVALLKRWLRESVLTVAYCWASLKRFRKLILIGFGACIVLAVLAVWIGRPYYRHHKEKRFVTMAKDFLKQGKIPNATLSARLALSLNPTNVEACRVMVGAAEASGAPEAVFWLQKVVDLEPNAFTNRLHLAKAAFLRRDLARAQKALSGVDEASRKTAAYHEMAGLLAVAANKLDESEAHLTEAAKLDPENKRLQLNLAVLQLQDRDQGVAQGARASLEKLSTDEKFRLDALRVLANAAVRSNDLAGALGSTRRLIADPAASLSDRLLHLSLLAQAKDAGYAGYLAALQKEVEKKPEEVYGLTGWMISRRLADEAWKWLNALPSETKKEVPVLIATADALMAKKDWAALGPLLQKEKWGNLEFCRLGLQARAAFETQQTVAQESYWRAAVREAGEKPRALAALVQMASAWKWQEEKESLLWLIAQKQPREPWPLKELSRLYLEAGDTSGLHKVYAAMLSSDAKSLRAKNDLATTSLLLKTNLTQAQTLAKEAFEQRPEDPAVSTTYAYALHVQGQTAEALKVLEKLKPQHLEIPSIAVYYGVILRATGQTNSAKKYLTLASKGRLLPEERLLAQETIKGL
ncbi:MAG: tetratricopeptide repeat protein [Verrucomicrobia bacterium]|nr:tetratricopeptide repeat protein [Verrucomicrobiota bacterium]